jgi:hypothetical protein
VTVADDRVRAVTCAALSIRTPPKALLCHTCPSIAKEYSMANDQQNQDQNTQAATQPQAQPQAQAQAQAQAQDKPAQPDFDGLKNKKPEELTPEELRLMADTMPGEGPGD